MKKVYDIFVSDSVEPSVRRSAADQLVTILAGWCFLAYLFFSVITVSHVVVTHVYNTYHRVSTSRCK